MKQFKVIVVYLIAILISPLGVAPATAIHACNFGNHNCNDWLFWSIYGLPVAYVIVIFIGLPIYILLKKLYKANIFTVGFFGLMLPLVIFSIRSGKIGNAEEIFLTSLPGLFVSLLFHFIVKTINDYISELREAD